MDANQPALFATWTFFEHDMQYTPVIKGPQAQLDCSAYYKVKLDEAFLDYLMDSSVMVEIHMTSHDSDQPQCQSVGQAELKLTEVVHYPSNKLHGSVLVIAPPQTDKEPKVIGSLDYWFKLHTAATSKIQDWLDHREEVQRVLDGVTDNESKLASEVDLLQGEQRAIKLPENQDKLIGKRKKQPDPDPVQPPPQILSKKPEKEKVSKRKLKKSKGVECEEEPIKEVLETKDQKSNEELIKPKEESTVHPDEVTKPESEKAVIDDEEVKPIPKPRAPAQAPLEIVSQEEVKEKSEWDSDNEKSPAKKIPDKDEQVASDEKGAASPNENQESKELEVMGKNDDEASESEEEDESESDEEESEEESESEEEEEDDDETESEEESDDDNEKPKEVTDERKIEEKPKSTTIEDSDNDLSMTTASSEPIGGIRRVKELANSQDDSAATTTGGESSSTSHDSEGVVVRQASLAGDAKSSVNDSITITITEFKAGKNANFLKNKKIQKLFVEYSFLDLKAEETETPFALPKPQTAGESIVFNFSKVIPLDKQNHGSRRRLLTKILSNEKPSDSQDDQAIGKSSKTGKNLKTIVFSLVSEPDETEGKDGKCEDVGTATVDLEAIDKSGQDLVDAVLDVHSVEPQTRVSKFLGSKKIIGTLTVSVLAVDVFNSLKI